MPVKNIILETDSPYFPPRGVQRDISLPGDVAYVAAKVAELKGVTVESVLAANLKSVEHVYKIRPQ